MRVLLTGGGGFIGSRVPHLLARAGIDFVAIGRTRLDGPFRRFDLLRDDPEALLGGLGVTHLIHLAWNEDRSTLWNGPQNLDWVAATLRLVLAFRRAGGGRAVLAGSCAEYDWSHRLLDERTTPLLPASGYGLAKRALHDLTTGTPSLAPLSIGWARIFFPFGAADKPDRLLSQVIDGVAAGRPVACSHGSQVRPFIHVDDVAAAVVALLLSPVEGAVNIALAQTISVRDLAVAAAAAAGDPALVRFGARPARLDESAEMIASVGRLTREVGFTPRYDLAQAVAATVAERLGR